MSYARSDDEQDGDITRFREQLSTEVGKQIGKDFPIFQDRNDISWGQNWQQRINEALDAVTLLLVIITPRFFHSDACQREVDSFRERERKLGREDLILPVYYIKTPELEEPEANSLAQLLLSRQLVDWRKFRGESFTVRAVRKELQRLAGMICKTLRATSSGSDRSTPSRSPTHVVDPYGRGDSTMVTAAIEAARAGDRILVRPGLYEEGLAIDKPLEILGDGPVGDIVIEAWDADAISFEAEIGRVANLTLRQTGGEEGPWYGVDITQGLLTLEDCDITSQSGACVGIRNGADPRLRRNLIHNGRQMGVYVSNGGRGTLEENEITANAYTGVEITDHGFPTLRRNRIYGNGHQAVYCHGSGNYHYRDNDLEGNWQQLRNWWA